MSEPGAMRASDREREQVVERLQGAFEEGRLKLPEYLDRMSAATEAVTHGELAEVCADLPSGPAVPSPTPSSRVSLPPFARLPTALKVLWTIWLAAVSVNVVIWVLASATRGHLIYPWPLWVAGPSGAVLLVVSAATPGFRRPAGTAGPAEVTGRAGERAQD